MLRGAGGDELRVLATLWTRPGAWLGVDAVARYSGLDAGVAGDLMADLDVAGYLLLTETNACEPVAAISPAGAVRLRLKLRDEDDVDGEGYCWSDPGDTWAVHYQPRQPGTWGLDAGVDLVDADGEDLGNPREPEDPYPGPLDMAIALEEAERRGEVRPAEILGIACCPFPGPHACAMARSEAIPCPGCKGRAVARPRAYCVVCDRHGRGVSGAEDSPEIMVA